MFSEVDRQEEAWKVVDDLVSIRCTFYDAQRYNDPLSLSVISNSNVKRKHVIPTVLQVFDVIIRSGEPYRR